MMSKRLNRMPRNPAGDWTIGDVEAVCREHGVCASRPAVAARSKKSGTRRWGRRLRSLQSLRGVHHPIAGKGCVMPPRTERWAARQLLIARDALRCKLDA